MLFLINSILFGQNHNIGKTKDEIIKNHEGNFYCKEASFPSKIVKYNVLAYHYFDGVTDMFSVIWFDKNNISVEQQDIFNKKNSRGLKDIMNRSIYVKRNLWMNRTDTCVYYRLTKGVNGGIIIDTFDKRLMTKNNGY